MKLLLIEDDISLAHTIRDSLKPLYAFDMAHSGRSGLTLAQYNEYDCILLDLNLPDDDGLDICRKLRSGGIHTPIIMLTARGQTEEKVAGLDRGADDYLVKPFSFVELQARIRALLRRGPETLADNTITVGDLSMNIATRTLTRQGKPIVLRRKEFDLLEYLLRNAGRVVTRSMILEHVWDSNMDPFTNAIDVHIKYLRDRIDRPFGTDIIKTVHGLGYSIDLPGAPSVVQKGGDAHATNSLPNSH